MSRMKLAGISRTTTPPLESARLAVILLHGRGSNTVDIMRVGEQWRLNDVAYVAPAAPNNTWYPNSFLAPISKNEPQLSESLYLVEIAIGRCLLAGLTHDRIALAGFSQGACLASEYVARNPKRYAALIAWTGGLLGPLGSDLKHEGSLEGTPVLLSSGDPDPHVPWQRVVETATELERMGAQVSLQRHAGRPHTILPAELAAARYLLESSVVAP
ncbi:MAG: dienelactone hydrolase family protein [Rhodospirillales bacterium]|nr:dienelactone hydrolase family protein [Acetobacter sp.]